MGAGLFVVANIRIFESDMYYLWIKGNNVTIAIVVMNMGCAQGVRASLQIQRKPANRRKGENLMDKKELTGNTMGTEMKSEAVVPAVSGTEESAKIVTDSEVKSADEKQAPAKKEAVPEVFLQYREYEVTMEEVTERVKSHYCAKGHQRESIENMQIYIKPEDFTAYYVINDGVVGKVNLF